jgi:hypothetical protein
MSMFQFSLRHLLIAVAAVAVGTAALLNANSWWASLLWAGALFMLLFAGLMVLFQREAPRAFWSGYLATATFYLFLVIFAGGTHVPLITTKVIGWGYSLFPDSKKSQYMTPTVPPAGGMGGGLMPTMQQGNQGFFPGSVGMPGLGGMGSWATANPDYIDPSEFMQVGHALWMFFLSWLGGPLALLLVRLRERSSPLPATAHP